jgi:hypothetical protein
MVPTTSHIGSAKIQWRGFILLPGIIAFTLLFDEILTYGLSVTFGRGGGAGALTLIFVCLCLAKHQLKGLSAVLFLIGACGIAVQVNSLSTNQLYIATITILILYIACFQTELSIPRTNIFFYALYIVLFFNILTLTGVDMFELISRLEVNRKTGLYTEPSHLAYYVIILYYLSIKTKPGSERRNAVPASLLLLLNFSLSAILPLALILRSASVRLKRPKKRWYALAGIVFLTLLLILKADYIAERNILSPVGEQSATTQVLLYYYSAFFYFAAHNPFIGFGPDMFFDAYTSYSNASFPMFGDFNSTDGSFLLVKLTGELGLATTFVFLFAICRRLNRNSNALLLIFLQYALLRGFGITSAIPISLLLLTMVITRPYAFKR